MCFALFTFMSSSCKAIAEYFKTLTTCVLLLVTMYFTYFCTFLAGGSFMRGAPGARTLPGETPVIPSTLTAPRPGTSSRGTSTLRTPGTTSSAEVPPANSDVITPEAESDASYGLSVSYVNQPSPSSNSRVIIRLQNHNPPTANNTSNATNDGDSGNNQVNNRESGNSDTPVKRSSPQIQFIKRSSSIEIKHGSNSPRNSYVAVCDGSPSPRKQHLTENSTPASSCSQTADSPTLERSPLLKSEMSTPPGNADVSVTWTRGSKPFRIPPGGATPGPSLDGRENTATCGAPIRRSPPQTLPIIPVTSTGGATGGSDQNYASGENSQTQPRKLNGWLSLSKSRASVNSPLSPTGGVQVMPRSGSVASQVSQFSVCSETGEKKRPKFSVVPIAISNDSPYPVSPISCNNRDPLVPGTSGSPGPRAQDSVDTSSGVSSTASDGISSQTPSSSSLSSGSSAVSSPLMESDTLMASATSPSASDSASQLDSRGSTLDRTKARRRSGPSSTNGAVTNGDVIDLSAINNNYVASSSNIEESPQMGDRYSRDSHPAGGGGGGQPVERSCVKPADIRTGATGSERPTAKKVKQRKRRSKENGGVGSSSGEAVTPTRISYVGGGTANDSRTSDFSDKHSRRPPKGRNSSASKFKQYGFIDDPELLTNRDTTSASSPSHHPDKPVYKQNSKERLSKDHRHSSQGKSKSRESSRERERRKRSGSRDRNVHKIDNDVNMTQRETQNTLDNAAFINRDATGSRNNKHGERRKHQGDHVTSSSLERRRKRRSTGDRTFPDSQNQGQGHKHSQTAPALNGYHDNEDIVIVDNDDDVFISNHSNEAVDNIHHYPTKHRGTRKNRHSVPNLDNCRTMQLDR